MYHFSYEYNTIYLVYVQMIKGSVIEQYSNQSSGCEESRDNCPICPRLGTKFREHTKCVGSIGLVLDAIINSVNCICLMDVAEIRYHKNNEFELLFFIQTC